MRFLLPAVFAISCNENPNNEHPRTPHRCFLLRSMGNNPDDTCYLLNTKFRFTGCDLCFLFNKNTIYELCWFSPVDFQFRLIRQANQITLGVNFISRFLTQLFAVCVILCLSKGVFVFYGVNVNGAVVLLVLVVVGGVVGFYIDFILSHPVN